jgi:MFS family permease
MDAQREQRRSLLPHPEEAPNATNTQRNNDYGTHTAEQDGVTVDDDIIPLILWSEDDSSDATSDEADRLMPLWSIVAILSTAFSYGCILTTLFLITLPIECERIQDARGSPKSVTLGIFVAIAGFTQLVSPLVGRASDTYEPPKIPAAGGAVLAELGQRLPYYMFGAAFAATGSLCQMFTSYASLWIRYGFAFFVSMVGLNIQYAMMLALIPDQVPREQTGVANGILALLLVTGSIFGFGLFHVFFSQDIGSMYGLYASIVILTSILTGSYAQDRDAELTSQRMLLRSYRASHKLSGFVPTPEDDESLSSSMDASILFHSKAWPMKARRATKKAMKHAVMKAQDIVVTPALIANSMAEPFRRLNSSSVLGCYTIDIEKYHNFFIVTLSRLFYYCGMSVQTFFLYFVHDIIHVRKNPEAAVATLAILGQCSGAFTCYPVGVISDRLLGGRRVPFVYVSCAILSTATLTLVFATTFHQMVLVCLVLGAANGAYLTAETSLAVDTLPSDFEMDDDSGSAQLLGIWGVAAFLGSALGPMIGGPLLFVFGQARNDDGTVSEEYRLTGYAVVLSLSSFYFICSAFTLRFLKSRHERHV